MILRLLLPSLLVLTAGASTPVPQGATGAVRPAVSPVARVQAANDEIVIHRLKPGETLEDIAATAFVSPSLLAEARAFNRLRADQKLPAGFPLRLKSGWLSHQRLAAEVISFSGPSLVDIGTASTPVALGMLLTEGDRIRTSANGYVTLRLEDGSKIALPSNSNVRIERLRQVALSGAVDRRFRLEDGKVDAKVTPLKPDGSRFLITTPVSVAAVRGTRYRVSYTPQSMRSTTGVVEGRVAVAAGADADAPAGVLLTANQGTLVTGTGVLKPVRLSPAPVIEQISTSPTDRSVTVRFRPVAGTGRYLVQWSRDEEGLELVAAVETDRTRVTKKDLPAGRYHVQVMAMDGMGLSGISADTSIDQPVGRGTADQKERKEDNGLAMIAANPEAPGPVEEGSAFDDPAAVETSLVPVGSFGGGGMSIGGWGFGLTENPLAPDPLSDSASDVGPEGGPGPGVGGPGGGSGDGVGGGPVPVTPPGGGGGGGTGGGGAGGPSGGGGGGGGAGGGAGDPGDGFGGPGGGGGIPGGGGGLPGGGGVPGGGVVGPGDGGVLPDLPDEGAPTTAVPEPATWAMLLAGFGFIGLVIRRRRARRRGSVQPAP